MESRKRKKEFEVALHIDREVLEDLYWKEKLSMGKIAERLGYTRAKIWGDFRYWGIPRRHHAEACRIAGHKWSEEDRKRISRQLTGRKQSKETIRKRFLWRKGYSHSIETRKKMSRTNKKNGKMRELWQNNEWAENILKAQYKGRKKRPTSIETRFMDIVQKHDLPYNYVGDGKVWIARMCPDFIRTDGEKEVVELFSRWWHDPSVNGKVSIEQTEDYRAKHYAKYGFNAIFIWEDELENENLVLNKLSL